MQASPSNPTDAAVGSGTTEKAMEAIPAFCHQCGNQDGSHPSLFVTLQLCRLAVPDNFSFVIHSSWTPDSKSTLWKQEPE
ncbi:hypothetical protein ADH72_01825 [Akkermansia muciniphila]|uniref:hypothetical protein n=1 Tax=Akkermansia muciniphila TaxID=239935 RepID=UPI00080C3B7F|nr:hypothetical protein [Akkermansia muciniphila]ANU61034.1 hypothetical protein A4V05_06105 [Akkermansia muciniphila]ASB34525.1 hypothetical protein ADH72_01825 [Akkermansia muciniphila]QQR34119.1 hypothetical protein I5Q85_04765 [Akkermansia muciniphila]